MEYEDRITIPTPEGVSLEYTLAGLGSRGTAGAVDLFLKVVLFFLIAIVAMAALGDAGFLAVAPAGVLAMLAYDVLFETLGDGRTPGKRMLGLRVVRSSGRREDFVASVIRNAMRLVDGLPLFYVPTIVGIAVTKRNQRPGDVAADTVVVRERRAVDRVAPVGAPAAAAAAAQRGANWDVSAVPAADLAPVRSFLERRASLDRGARARVAARLDGALRPRVGGVDEPDPERFLEILYEAKRARG